MITTTATEHTCHGATFCGQPRAAAQAECPACPPPARPLQEVLTEHVDEVAAARRLALEQLAAHALPADAPGAWIRNAIERGLEKTGDGPWQPVGTAAAAAEQAELDAAVSEGRACGDHDRPTPCLECR